MSAERKKPINKDYEHDLNDLRNQIMDLRMREEALVTRVLEARNLIDEHIKHLNPIASGFISGAITAILILTFKFTGVL